MKLEILASCRQNWQLIKRLSEREIRAKYRGSMLGATWSVINPLLMLAIYTFVFSTIFKARWQAGADTTSTGYALNLLAGLTLFNCFAECATAAPSLISTNSSYVTKVVFPLEVLGIVRLASASFNMLISIVILAAFQLFATSTLHATYLFLPLILAPFLLGVLALTWLLSAFAVYLRDIGQLMNFATSALMFLSAIFYPISSLPAAWQPWIGANPIAVAVEQFRSVIISGNQPSHAFIVLGTVATFAAAEASLRLFKRLSNGFADVL